MTIRAQRHVVLGVGRHFEAIARFERDGSTTVELTVRGDTLAFGAPALTTLRLPEGKLRDVVRALASLAGELGVRP